MTPITSAIRTGPPRSKGYRYSPGVRSRAHFFSANATGRGPQPDSQTQGREQLQTKGVGGAGRGADLQGAVAYVGVCSHRDLCGCLRFARLDVAYGDWPMSAA
jgi:hypothetical protein